MYKETVAVFLVLINPCTKETANLYEGWPPIVTDVPSILQSVQPEEASENYVFDVGRTEQLERIGKTGGIAKEIVLWSADAKTDADIARLKESRVEAPEIEGFNDGGKEVRQK